ncbi:MAG: MFS transporter [Devosia sp.]
MIGAGGRGLRSLPTAIWALGLVSMLMDVSSEMIHALLPVYLVTGLGATALTVGVIEGIAEATAAITKVFSGALSDWLGKRKNLALLGYGLAAVTKPVFAIATSIGWLVAARFVDRIGKGMRGAPRDALIADISRPEQRGAAFGLRQSLDTIGAVLGPALAVLLMWATADSFRTVFALAVIPAVACVLVLFFFVKEPERPADLRQVRAPLSLTELGRLGPAYWTVTGIATLFTLARFSEAFLLLRAQEMGLAIALVPLVLVGMNVAYTLAAYPAGALGDRVNKISVLALGFVLLIAADGLLVVDGAWALGAGVLLWGLHMGFTQGLFASLVAETAPPELRGTGFGMFNMLGGVALLVASILAGLLWDRFGAGATFAAGAGITALCLAGLLVIRRAMPGLGAPDGSS